jgi:secreted trypsin-like serine protease
MRLAKASPVLLALWLSPSRGEALYGASVVPGGQADAAVSFKWTMPGQWGTCSGVLIGSRAVLTAAHCVRAESTARVVRSVRVGNPAGRTTQAVVASVHVHPGYNPRQPAAGSDLAVLVLKAAVAGHTPVRVARSADDPRTQGEKLTIFGSGLTREKGRLGSPKLRQIVLELLSPFHCFTGPVKKMAETRLCAASTTSGVCPGDSGSPAIWKNGGQELVVGIVSLAIDRKTCAETATTLIRVSAFSDWISRLIPDGAAGN